jgi:hypothetical protein
MIRINRRSFVERLSLGAGAVFLSPIVGGLVNEAHGQVVGKKRLVIVAEGNGFNYAQCFAPPEFKDQKNIGGQLVATDQFTMPASVKALEKYRSRMLWVDGLTNTQHEMGGHFGRYVGFSCVPMNGLAANSKTELSGTPGGITFDQYIASTVGKGAVFKSVDLGMTEPARLQQSPIINEPFAYGKDQPVPTQCSPSMAFARLFKNVPTGQPMPGQDAGLVLQRKRILFDAVRDDIKRVQAALAGRERQKLDEYLAGIGALEERLTQLSNSAKGVSCSLSPVKDPGDVEGILEAQFDVATNALACGLTQVVTIASATGRLFGVNFGRFTPLGKHGLGHGGGNFPNELNAIHNFHASLIAKMLDRLSALREGTRTVADNTLVLYTSENGEQHHARHFRWPVVLVGDLGGALKANGRFVKYPALSSQRAPRTDAHRPLRDLYITLSHALGAPNDDFGGGVSGGYETARSRGVLTELI